MMKIQTALILALGLFCGCRPGREAASPPPKPEPVEVRLVVATNTPGAIKMVKKGKSGEEELHVSDQVDLDSSFISQALIIRKDRSEKKFLVHVKVKDSKIDFLADYSKKHVNERLAIIVGGQLVLAPKLVEPILLGTFILDDDFTISEAANLVARINPQ